MAKTPPIPLDQRAGSGYHPDISQPPADVRRRRSAEANRERLKQTVGPARQVQDR
ncbi:MAG: hypothetical protein ACRED8_12130 [Caulobacteraceae bacterium]